MLEDSGKAKAITSVSKPPNNIFAVLRKNTINTNEKNTNLNIPEMCT
jgi:hypothetical protein